MSTIVTRAGKGSALTHTEVDANFTNLNTDKLQVGSGGLTASLAELNTSVGNLSGSYTATSTGMVVEFTTTVYYRVVGNVVHLEARDTGMTATSDATTFTLTGAPAAIRPASTTGFTMCLVVDNSAATVGKIQMNSSGTIIIEKSTGVFTTSGAKKIYEFSMTYMLTLP